MTLKRQKRVSLSALAALLFQILIGTCVFAHNQPSSTELSRSEILDGWASALGGYKTLSGVKCMHLHAKLKTGGMKGQFDRWVTSDGRLHEIIDIPGAFHQENVLARREGWTLDPSGKVHELSGGELQDLITNAYESSWSFLLPGRMSGQADFLGGDNKHQFYLWRLLPAGGKPMTVFLAKKDFQPVREETRQGASTVTTVFSEWRTISGLHVPGLMRQSNGDPQFDTTFEMEDLEVNPPVEPSFFHRPQETAAEVRYTGSSRSLEIPIDVTGNRIFVQGRVNGSAPGWFMLDSGSETSVITTEWASKLGLRGNGAIGTVGSGGSASMSFAKDVVFDFPGVTVPAKTVAILDFSQLTPFLGRSMMGLLGYDIISRFVIRLDYERKIIELTDPQNFQRLGGGVEIPMNFVGDTPQIGIKILLPGHTPIDTTAIIDTGANNLLLTSPFVASHDVISAVGTTIAKPTLGVGGGTDSVEGRIGGIQIGPYLLNRPVALFVRGGKGGLSDPSFGASIGGEILRRFIITFDYGKKRLFLQPNRRFNDRFAVDGSGLQMAHEGSDFKILRVDGVRQNSPAASAGIQKGDVIVGIDGRPASDFTADQIDGLFEDNGRSYDLRLQRGNKAINVVLKIHVPF